MHRPHRRRLLFLLHRRPYPYFSPPGPCFPEKPEAPQPPNWPWGLSSGLLNSVMFLVDMLNASGVETQMVQVNDGNDIDREVTQRDPTDVILEAFWATPEKLCELTKLHRHRGRRWFVRSHSEVPFLANEGMAFTWIAEYLKNPEVTVTSNTARSVRDLRGLAHAWHPHWGEHHIKHRVIELPNWYPLQPPLPRVPSLPGELNVGCFGAIRPLKNQFIQAVASLAVADALHRHLRFHVNGGRIEGGGENIAKNLRAIFAAAPHAELVEHEWMTRPQFLNICRRMDIGLQVSFSETFNIVTADFVTCDVPVVVSPEISWILPRFQASETDRDDIIRRMLDALCECDPTANRRGLIAYDDRSQEAWLRLFGGVGRNHT